MSCSYTGNLPLDLAAGLGYYAYSKYRDYNRSVPSVGMSMGDQSGGQRRVVLRKVVGGRKRFSRQKILNSTLNYTELCLGTREQRTTVDGAVGVKHLVSEFNPTSAGFYPISQNSQMGLTPMHCYDLNFYPGNAEDSLKSFPSVSTTQCGDINARAWIWKGDNTWAPLGRFQNDGTTTNADVTLSVGSLYPPLNYATEPRYYINEAKTNFQANFPTSTKIYRKGIAIDYMLYGCTKMPTEFDVRVIKILDPKMCPDYGESLSNSTSVSGGTHLTDFRQYWQNMIRAYTQNPLLNGIEPGPKAPRRWFKTVAKQRVRIGEQTTSIDTIPAYQGRIYVNVNEAQKYGGWDNKDFTLETGMSVYDNVPKIDDNVGNDNFHHKPYYTSRYYLLIRALSPVDVYSTGSDGTHTGGNVDYPAYSGLSGVSGGGTPITMTAGPHGFGSNFPDKLHFSPSYDLAIRTTWMTVNGI